MWADLTQPFHADVPTRSLPAAEFRTLRDVREDGTNVQWYGAPTHVGTHVDAPRHFVPGGATIDDLPLDRFAGEAVVLDVARDEPERIPTGDVAAAATDAGGLGEPDVVLLRTGWGGRYGDPDYGRYPWFAAGVGEWLVERGAKLVGVDTPSPDRPRAMRPDDWDAYPLHRALLGAGVLIAEHLDLSELAAGERVEAFGFPLRFRDGDGAPCRFVARR